MSNTEPKQYLTVRQLTEKYPAFPQGGLRHYIFHEKENGFAYCIRRVGRRVLISEADFFAWVEGQRPSAQHSA